MNEQFLAALQAENLPVSLDESLGRHTTFRIGGNADFFCVPATVTQLTRILELCRQYQVRTYLLGNGSNTLFSDSSRLTGRFSACKAARNCSFISKPHKRLR